MEDLLTKIKYAFAHQAIVEGLQIKKEHVDRLAEIAVRLCNEHSANTYVMLSLPSDDEIKIMAQADTIVADRQFFYQRGAKAIRDDIEKRNKRGNGA